MELKEKIRKFAEDVHPIYVLLKWEWHYTGVPTVEQIEETLTRLIQDSVKDNNSGWQTGGLYVQKDVEIENEWSFGMEIYGKHFFSNEVSGVPTPQ